MDKKMLTISYITNRLNCCIEWFIDSLINQVKEEKPSIPIRVVIVDFNADKRQSTFLSNLESSGLFEKVIHTEPKPTVWQGKNRLTTKHYFAASNARNTSILNAPDGHLAYVDDLSVLSQGWLKRVLKCVESSEPFIAVGTYQKVRKINVENGIIKDCEEYSTGFDSRYLFSIRHCITNGVPDEYVGSELVGLYGCSLVGPLEAFLQVNGWDEDCDSMGYEDVSMGFMLKKNGWKILFDPNMKTIESEDHHHLETPFLRIDKNTVKDFKDASHKMMAHLKAGRNVAPNFFGDGGIRKVRDDVLNGAPYPNVGVPQNDWRDGQPLTEM